MINITTAAIFLLAAGIFTSVTILSGYQVLITIPIIYYVFLAIKNRNFKLPLSGWFLLAFTGIALLSLVLNFDIIPKPSKNFGRVKYFLYGLGCIFVLKIWLVESSDKIKKIITNVFFLSIVVSAGYAIYTITTVEDGRAKGLTETMRYGYGTGMALLVLLGGILHKEKIKNWFDYRLAIIAFIFGFIGMYLTYTRGALLGFLCGLPFVLYYYRAKIGIAIGGLAVIAVLGLVGFYLFGTTNLNNRFLTSKNNTSDTIRRSQWKAAIISIKERPALGWGLSNFHTQLQRIKTEHDLDAKNYYDAHSHNLFLEIASGTGLIGFFFFLGWLVCWAKESFEAKGLTRAIVVPFGVAFVVSSQFEVTFDANNASMIFFLYALSVRSKNV